VLLVGSALACSWSVLQPAEAGSVGHWGQLLVSSHRRHPCSVPAPLLPKTCHVNPVRDRISQNLCGFGEDVIILIASFLLVAGVKRPCKITSLAGVFGKDLASSPVSSYIENV